MPATIQGLDQIQNIFADLRREVDDGRRHFIKEIGEEAEYLAAARLDGDFPDPGGIRFLNTYWHEKLGEVDHLTVQHTKTGKLSKGIKASPTMFGVQLVASAQGDGGDYAAVIAQEDVENVGMDYLSFSGYKIIKQMESGQLSSIVKQSFPRFN